MPEINYDDIYNQLVGFIDTVTTKENINKKDLENLIEKVEKNIDLDTFLLIAESEDDLPFKH